jgi:hypothetical protein
MKEQMVMSEQYIKVKKNDDPNTKHLEEKPLVEVTRSTEPDTGEDVYLVQSNSKHQFASHISPVYGTKEYYWTGVLQKDTQIKFVHNNGKQIPIHEYSNCGYTLIGKAQNYFTSKKALSAKGESCDDQEYIYINQHSQLIYTGESEEHTLFLRIYDNLDGIENDRWVVISIE